MKMVLNHITKIKKNASTQNLGGWWEGEIAMEQNGHFPIHRSRHNRGNERLCRHSAMN